MNNTIITILGYIFGAGGLLAFLIQWRAAKHTESQDAVENWHQLYTATLQNITRVETENTQLKQQLADLQTKIISLTVELEGYKRFERYVAELEVYSNTLLHVIEPLVSKSAYKKLQASKPIRVQLDAEDILDNVHETTEKLNDKEE